MVTGSLSVVATYGERFREVREALGLTQEQARDKLKLERQSNISAIERRKGTPKPVTILHHAKMLGCQPSDLMAGVETEYDLIRAGAHDRAGKVGVAIEIHHGLAVPPGLESAISTVVEAAVATRQAAGQAADEKRQRARKATPSLKGKSKSQ